MQAIHRAILAILLASLPALQPVRSQDASTAPRTGSTPAGDGRTAPRYFDVVNASHDSVEALAIAPAGSGAFQAVDIGGRLRGGVTPITLDVPAGGCLRDIRVDFNDGRRLLYPALDLCRAGALRLSPRDGRDTDTGAWRAAGAPARPAPGTSD